MESRNLLEAAVAASSANVTVNIPLVAGRAYLVDLDFVGPATAYAQIYTRTAKGKTAVKRQTGPGHLAHRFIADKTMVGLFFELKGTGARYENATVVEEDARPALEAAPLPEPELKPVWGKVKIGSNLAWGSFGADRNVIGIDYGYLDYRWRDWTRDCRWPVVRLDFKAHRLFAYAGGPFRGYEEWATGVLKPSKCDIIQLKREVRDLHAVDTVETIILDNHGYGYHASNLVGSVAYPIEAFAREWGALAKEMAEFPKCGFGLMNEPKVSSNAEVQMLACLAAIVEIRKYHQGPIFVPRPSGYAGAQSAAKDFALMERLRPVDPNWMWEVHWYPCRDNSGTTEVDDESCIQDVVGQLTAVTDWARRTRSRLFLGEYGVGSTPKCVAHIRQLLIFMQDNSDVWWGVTWWDAGMGKQLIRHIGPKAKMTPMPQETTLKEFL